MPKLPRLLSRGRTVILALLASAFAFSAFAQDDPPGRIGRIAWLSGEVLLDDPETGESDAVPLNQPLTSGDIITTQPGARAEIQIGASTIRLDANSRLEFDRIDDNQIRVILSEGRIVAKLPTEDTRRDFVLETERGRFVPRSTGTYRFDRDAENTNATAYFGTLRFEGRDIAFDIGAGESAHTWIDDTGRLRYRMAQGVRDEFTQWSAARDQELRNATASQYVSPEMTGVQDLEAYGDWSEEPEYGAVWFPRAVAVDWAPYRTGRWSWVAPWGWTWIGYEPWGFAPFHYGRWIYARDRWGWVPGARIARPVYAPALVAWSSAPGVGVAVRSVPPAGWFPLAPREVYVPFYRSSSSYVRFVNAPHVSHIRNVGEIVMRPHEVVRQTRFSYRDNPRAFSTASADAFRQRWTGPGNRPGDIDRSRDFRGRPPHINMGPRDPQRADETLAQAVRTDRQFNDNGYSPQRHNPADRASRREWSMNDSPRPRARDDNTYPFRRDDAPARDPARDRFRENNWQGRTATRAERPMNEYRPAPAMRDGSRERSPDFSRQQRREGTLVEARHERREERAQPPRQERGARSDDRGSQDRRSDRSERFGGRGGR